MKSFVKYLLMLFVSFNVITSVTQADPNTEEQTKQKSKRLLEAESALSALDPKILAGNCFTPDKNNEEPCKGYLAKQKYWEDIENGILSKSSNYNQNSCVEDNKLLNEAIGKAKNKCSAVRLSSIPACQKQAQICDDEETEPRSTQTRRGRRAVKKVCKADLLVKITQDDKRYKGLLEDAETNKSITERLREDINAMRQQLINLQGRKADAIIASEQVVRDAAKENARLGQEAVQQAISIQLEIDKTKFEVEDLITSKAAELAKAKNAVEDLDLDCYGKAIDRYNREHESCLTNKRNKISSGTYSTNSLKGLFSSTRRGSCKAKNRRLWYQKYKNQCKVDNEFGYQNKIKAVKEQYKQTAKNIETTIKRKNKAIEMLITQLETFEKNNGQLNKQLLDEQKAALKTASNKVLEIEEELRLMNKRIFDAEGQLRKEQSAEEEIKRNTKLVKEEQAKDKENVSDHGEDNIEQAQKYSEAFGELTNILAPLKDAIASCCDSDNPNATICQKVKSTGSNSGYTVDSDNNVTNSN